MHFEIQAARRELDRAVAEFGWTFVRKVSQGMGLADLDSLVDRTLVDDLEANLPPDADVPGLSLDLAQTRVGSALVVLDCFPESDLTESERAERADRHNTVGSFPDDLGTRAVWDFLSARGRVAAIALGRPGGFTKPEWCATRLGGFQTAAGNGSPGGAEPEGALTLPDISGDVRLGSMFTTQGPDDLPDAALHAEVRDLLAARGVVFRPVFDSDGAVETFTVEIDGQSRAVVVPEDARLPLVLSPVPGEGLAVSVEPVQVTERDDGTFVATRGDDTGTGRDVGLL